MILFCAGRSLYCLKSGVDPRKSPDRLNETFQLDSRSDQGPVRQHEEAPMKVTLFFGRRIELINLLKVKWPAMLSRVAKWLCAYCAISGNSKELRNALSVRIQ